MGVKPAPTIRAANVSSEEAALSPVFKRRSTFANPSSFSQAERVIPFSMAGAINIKPRSFDEWISASRSGQILKSVDNAPSTVSRSSGGEFPAHQFPMNSFQVCPKIAGSAIGVEVKKLISV